MITLEPHPHDVDVKALLRVAVVHNAPIACNRTTADFLLSSPLMRRDYQRLIAEVGRRVEVGRGLDSDGYKSIDLLTRA